MHMFEPWGKEMQVGVAVGTEALVMAPAARSSFGQWVREHRGRGALEVTILFVLLQLGCILYWAKDPTKFAYLSAANLSVMSQSIPWLGLLAIGAGVLMIAGEFDLSLAMNMGMCELIFIRWYGNGHSAWLCAALAIVVGIGIAAINALIINTFHISSFIATLGMASFWWGMQNMYVGAGGSAPTPRIDDAKLSKQLKQVISAELGLGIRAQMLWLAGVGILAWTFMHRHKLGNHLFAVGGNENAARAISINPKRVKLLAFCILGALCGLAAVLQGVQARTLIPGSGAGYELEAIAGAVIGGCSLRGGKGSVFGMILGVAFVKTFQAIVLLSSLPSYYLKLFIGVMTVIFVIINQYFEGKAE
jgi:simple sugar transport system permease protein